MPPRVAIRPVSCSCLRQESPRPYATSYAGRRREARRPGGSRARPANRQAEETAHPSRPLTVDGLIYVSSMGMLDCARRKVPMPALARWQLGVGITATLAANLAHGLGHGLIGAGVAAWPAIALVGSYELLMMIIRAAQVPGTATASHGVPERMPDTDPLQAQAAQAFAVELAAGRVPSVRAIRARLHVGNHVPSEYARTWPYSKARRARVPLEHPAAVPGFRRLPYWTPTGRAIIRLMHALRRDA